MKQQISTVLPIYKYLVSFTKLLGEQELEQEIISEEQFFFVDILRKKREFNCLCGTCADVRNFVRSRDILKHEYNNFVLILGRVRRRIRICCVSSRRTS